MRYRATPTSLIFAVSRPLLSSTLRAFMSECITCGKAQHCITTLKIHMAGAAVAAGCQCLPMCSCQPAGSSQQGPAACRHDNSKQCRLRRHSHRASAESGGHARCPAQWTARGGTTAAPHSGHHSAPPAGRHPAADATAQWCIMTRLWVRVAQLASRSMPAMVPLVMRPSQP